MAGHQEDKESLLKLFKTSRDNNVPCQARAGELAEKLGLPAGEFKYSNGWLDRFKDRCRISFKCICREDNSVGTGSEHMG